jgi:hypothetical protein
MEKRWKHSMRMQKLRLMLVALMTWPLLLLKKTVVAVTLMPILHQI